MPHEVIMPALGMAQETGLIVAWLKRPGDAVAEGEPIMEVETDKATMEVSAQADGFLADIRASEGENVPVGNVVAMIADTAEEAEAMVSPSAGGAAATETEGDPPPTGTEREGKAVIMPALGMAQDSGKIVSWLKAPGDPVTDDEPLLEVETDKATMEVPAGATGFLSVVLAEAGDDVPVGKAIAVISPERPETARRGTARPQRPATPAAAPAPTPEHTVAAPMKSARAAPTSADPSGRILASPKARRLARERGLDLARLADAGHPQPFHVADLEILESLSATRAAPATEAMAAFRIEARVPAEGWLSFNSWLASERPAQSQGHLLAAFAAAAWRSAQGGEDVMLRLERPGAAAETLQDPDLPRSRDRAGDDLALALILRDMTGTRLTAARLGCAGVPVLSVARDGADLNLALDFPSVSLEEDTALEILAGFSERLETPLRQLL